MFRDNVLIRDRAQWFAWRTDSVKTQGKKALCGGENGEEAHVTETK